MLYLYQTVQARNEIAARNIKLKLDRLFVKPGAGTLSQRGKVKIEVQPCGMTRFHTRAHDLMSFGL
jgi:hypothetical protein